MRSTAWKAFAKACLKQQGVASEDEVDDNFFPKNLTAAPFRMTSNGFGRNLVIAEVGGMGNLYPELHKEKQYDIQEICEKCGAPKAFVFGPGACPSRVVGAGELVADANLSENKVSSKVTTLVKDHFLKYKTKIINSTKFSLMGNLVVSEQPGPSECSERTGEDSLPGCIRKGMGEHYGQ
ncbi:hypothetical protein ANCDUO_10715, partial [Ancylostoma duodenale]